MPSAQHEAPLELIRRRAALGVELLTDVAGVAVPAHRYVTVADSTLTELAPTQLIADTVLTLTDDDRNPVAGVVIENQRSTDPNKRRSWPYYTSTLHYRLRKPVFLLVLCSTEAVARWAAEPIDTGSTVTTPIVLSPQNMPLITDPAAARAEPDLALLSALFHPRERAVLKALTAVFAPDVPDHELYNLLSRLALPEQSRELLETLMSILDLPWVQNSEYAHELRDQGKAEGKAEALLTVLRSRGVIVDTGTRDRILACTDSEQLERWLTRAIVVGSADELFG